MIQIFTDGSALGNPGPGGLGIVIIKDGNLHYSRSVASPKIVTNNRMELLAIYMSLKLLNENPTEFKSQDISITSDSKYVLDSILKGWATNWIRKKDTGRPNYDLWLLTISQYDIARSEYSLELLWVKGHAGNEYNELADRLACQGSAESRELMNNQITV